MKESSKKVIIGYYRICDLVTMLSTIFAMIGIIFAINNKYTCSMGMLIFCGICDMLDGHLARKRKSTEEEKYYGFNLDSLSDMIAFGVFPAILTICMFDNFYIKLVSIFFVLCGLIRLANFNMREQIRQKNNDMSKAKFVGVPITTISIIYPILYVILMRCPIKSIFFCIILFTTSISYIIKIDIPKVDVICWLKKISKVLFNEYLITFVYFPIFIIVGSSIFYNIKINGFNSFILSCLKMMLKNWQSNLTIFVLVDMIVLFFNGLFKSSKKSIVIVSIITLILLVINDIKFTIMGIPLVFSDINYLNIDNIGMMGTASQTIGGWIWSTIIKSLVFIIAVLIFILLKKEIVKIDKIRNRIFSIIISIAAITTFVVMSISNPTYTITKFFGVEPVYISQQIKENVNCQFGFYQGTIIEALMNIKREPENYDKNNSMEQLNNISDEFKENKWEKANIVFLLSESFFDIDNVNEITFDKNLTDFYDSLENKSNADTFDILVSTYGGASVVSEFELLTGGGTKIWNSGYIPWNSYYTTYKSSFAPNIIKELNNNDYYTMYLTPWGNKSFNSEKVYNLFGTKETKYGDSLKGVNKGLYYSDDSLMDDIINELKKDTKEKYKFIEVATGENHYPFLADKYEKYDINIKDSSLSEDESNALLSYAQGAYDADKALEKLYNAILELETPTIVLFYGDHLPFMTNDKGENLLLSTEYFSTDDVNINNIRKHRTKGAIFSNYDIDLEDLKFINLQYIGSYILNNMDLEISNWFKYVEILRKDIPVYNSSVIYSEEENTYCLYENCDKEKVNLINDFNKNQYYMFYDYEQ